MSEKTFDIIDRELTVELRHKWTWLFDRKHADDRVVDETIKTCEQLCSRLNSKGRDIVIKLLRQYQRSIYVEVLRSAVNYAVRVQNEPTNMFDNDHSEAKPEENKGYDWLMSMTRFQYYQMLTCFVKYLKQNLSFATALTLINIVPRNLDSLKPELNDFYYSRCLNSKNHVELPSVTEHEIEQLKQWVKGQREKAMTEYPF